MKMQSNLIELKALALVLAAESLQIRRFVAESLSGQTSDYLNLCREEFPKIEWIRRVDQAAIKISRWDSQGIHSCSYFENRYPDALRTIEDPPPILFFKGSSLTELTTRCCLAVVGSRRPDQDGLEIAQQFSRELARFGVVIISGLALGIDGAAHRGALEGSAVLATVAVLGGGIDAIYPPQHLSLAEEIVNQGGILLSQFEPETPPYPSNFLNRNRVVSGLSRAALVIQATLKSGSLVTARNAMEQGKEVLVIPGDINNPRFEGSNKIIQQGAALVTSVSDVLEALGISGTSAKKNPATNGHPSPLRSKIEKDIIETLEQRKEIRVDELVRQLGSISFEKELLMLELQGVIQRLPGNILRLKR